MKEFVEKLREKEDIFEKSGCAVDGIVKDYRKAADITEGLYEKSDISGFVEKLFSGEIEMEKNQINTVTVRWFDGYMEIFKATEVRFGNAYLWMRLEDGNNRYIPLTQVRWFGLSIESHQVNGM